MKRLFILIVVIVLTGAVGIASAETFDTSHYGNWTEFIINSTLARTNYQVNLTLLNTTGASSGSVFYTNGTTRSDWADIAFTDTSNATIPYWMENRTNTATTSYWWVNLSSIASDNTTKFRIWYGNSSQSVSFANGSATFPLFDDFDAATINTALWEGTTAAATLSGSYLSVVGTGSGSAGGLGWNYVNSKINFPTNYSFTSRTKLQNASTNGGNTLLFRDGTGCGLADILHSGDANSNKLRVFTSPSCGASSTGTTNITNGIYRRYSIVRNNTTGVDFLNDYTHMLGSPLTTNIPTGDIPVQFGAEGADHPISIDWIYVRQYIFPEPTLTLSGIGSSSEPGELVASFNSNTTSGFSPLSVQFSDTSTGTPTSWNWSFGDGAYDDTQNPSHEYTSYGTKTVTLNASTSSNYSISSDDINVYEYEPIPGVSRYATVIYPDQGWEENNVQEATVFVDTDPQILETDTVYKMWYRGGWDNPQLGYAESTNGVNWTKYPNPVLAGYNCPFVMKYGNEYRLTATADGWTSGGTIFNSTNGLNWTPVGSVALGSAGTWDATSWGNNYVWNETPTSWHMLYEAMNASGVWKTGYATSTNGLNWTKYGSNPVISSTGMRGGVDVFIKNSTTNTYSALVHGSVSSTLPTDIYKYDSGDLTTWVASPTDAWFNRTGVDEGEGSAVGQVADPHLIFVSSSEYMYYEGSKDGSTGSGENNTVIKLALDGSVVDVNIPYPVASFTSNVTSGYPPLAVSFTDTSETDITNWSWTFTNTTPGNNTAIEFSTDQNPEMTFGNGHWHIGLNVTNASGTAETAGDYAISVSDSGGLSGWNRQDILMEGVYTLTINFQNSVTHAPIPVVTVLDSVGNNQTTSTGTFTGTYNYSVVVVYATSDGYVSTSRSYVMDEDRTATVYLTESDDGLVPSAATVQSYPKYVTFHVKQGWGADLDEVFIEMTPVSTSTGDWDWLATILGVDLGEVPLNTNAMNQTTDSFGTATFYVFPTAKYNVTFTKAGYTIPSMILVPRDDHYIIYATSADTTYYKHGVNELEAVNLTITSVYVNETYSFLNMTYDDSTLHTTGGFINVTQQTGSAGSPAYTVIAAWPVTGNSFTNSTGISHNLNHVGGFVNATITHSDFGTIYRTFPFQFNSVPVSFLGFGANIQMLVAMGMMLFTAMLAGATHGKQVILVVAIEGWVFDTMGWFTHMISRGVPHYAIWTALTIMTVIAILANMANRKKWL